MTQFALNSQLEIGSIFEVAGTSIKVALKRDITELTRSHRGRVYDIGQIGSIIKIHMGRRILFASVRLLRLQTDEETAALTAAEGISYDQEKRVIEADLLGQGWYSPETNMLTFHRGVTTYPLPMQSVYLMTNDEVNTLFGSSERDRHGNEKHLFKIGSYAGTSNVECEANLDKLFGHHCAILGSTGTGKSSAVAAIIHALLEHNPTCNGGQTMHPSIILIDPHGEYTAAFKEQAQIYQAYNALSRQEENIKTLQLPYWLMSGEDFRSLITGKTEFLATTQSNVVYKALAHARMHEKGLVESATKDIESTDQYPPIDVPQPVEGIDQKQIDAFDRDKPLPFSLKEFKAHIINRQAKRYVKNKWEPVTASTFNAEFAPVLDKLRVLMNDTRLRFMMGELNGQQTSLKNILAQFISTNKKDQKPLKIVDISGLPNEVAGPLIAAIAKLIFNYKLHQTDKEREKDPVLFVCEEAHRYVPKSGAAEYEAAQAAIKKLAREGRKYGLGLMLVSQRPSDIENTVLSQCNSWLVLRLTNSQDQEYVRRMLPDNLAGITNILSGLQRQEALFVGEAAAIPAIIKLRTLTPEQLPRSNDVSFTQGWLSDGITSDELEMIVHRLTKPFQESHQDE